MHKIFENNSYVRNFIKIAMCIQLQKYMKAHIKKSISWYEIVHVFPTFDFKQWKLYLALHHRIKYAQKNFKILNGIYPLTTARFYGHLNRCINPYTSCNETLHGWKMWNIIMAIAAPFVRRCNPGELQWFFSSCTHLLLVQRSYPGPQLPSALPCPNTSKHIY